jgi:large repetitive protein
MGQLQKVSWRTAGYAMLSCAVAATAVVTVVRSDGVRPLSLSSNPTTRWLINTVNKEAVLVDGLARHVVARLDANSSSEVAVQGKGGVFLVAKSKGSLRTITTASLQLGTPRPLAALSENNVEFGVGPRGLTVVNSATAEASIIAIGDVNRPIKIPKSNKALVANDGSMWLLSDRQATHINVDETSHTMPRSGGVDKMTTVGPTAVGYDNGAKVVRWLDGGDVSVASVPNFFDAVLQEPGDAASCVWLGFQDTLVCVGRTGVERRFAVSGLAIGVGDHLAVAGSVAAVVHKDRAIVSVDLDTQRVIPGQTAGGGDSAALMITATGDMIWIDDTIGQNVWVANRYGVNPITKNDEKLPLLDSQGQVKGEGSGASGNGQVGGNASANDPNPTGLDRNGRDDPPNAVDDSVTARAGNSVTIPVTANDTEPDGQAIALVAVGKPKHGTTDMLNGSSVTYVPAPDYSGTDSFDYTISDETGLEAKAVVTVKLLAADAPNQPPVARLDRAYARPGNRVTIDVLANDIDPEREALSVRSFQQSSGAAVTDAKGASGFPALSYLAASDDLGGHMDTFTYQAADPEGGVSTLTDVKVEVVGDDIPNRPPTVQNDSARLKVDQVEKLAVLANDSDLDGDKLTLSLPPTKIPGVDAVVVQGDFLRITLLPDAPPRSVLVYKVDDGHGQVVEGHVLVIRFNGEVANRPPVANPDTERVVIGRSVKIPVTANDIDPDGDRPLIVTGVSQPDKAAGTVTIQDSATVVFQPNLPDITEPTPVTFTYEISDGKGNTATGSVAVTVLAEPLPQAPFARDDPAETVKNQPVTIDVLANDGDPSGGLPTLQTGPLVCPNGGRAEPTADRQRVVFTPPTDRTDTFRCTYHVVSQNGIGASASIIVVVTEPTQGNHDPDQGDTSYEVDSGKTKRVLVSELATDRDPRDNLQIDFVSEPVAGRVTSDGTSMTYVAPDVLTRLPVAVRVRIIDGAGGTLNETVTFTVNVAPTVTPPTPGLLPLVLPPLDTPNAFVSTRYEVDLLAAVKAANAPRVDVKIVDVVQTGTVGTVDGQDKVTFSSNVPGPVTASYRITDGQQTLPGTLAVNFVLPPTVNEPPVAQNDQVVVNSGTSGGVNVLENDSPNIDPAQNDKLSIRLIDQVDPAFGSVSLAGDGQLTFTPVVGIDGQRVVRYTISDGAKSDTATVTLTVNACTDIAPAATVANDFTPYKVPIDINLNKYVPAGLTFRSVSGATLTGPIGRYTPPDGENGSVTVTYVVANGCGQTAQGSLTIDVNRPPAARTVSSPVAVGKPVTLTANDLAVDDEALRIQSIDGTPAWVTSDGATITANPPAGTPAGTFSFTATVADTGGLTGVASVTLTISNRAPVAQPDFYRTAQNLFTFDPVLNDTDPENGVLTLQSIAPPPDHVTGNTVTVAPSHGPNTLTYIVRDDGGLTDTATVSILYNQAPTADPLLRVQVDQRTVNARIVALDPDEDTLIVTCDPTPGVTVEPTGLDLAITVDETVLNNVSFDCRVTDRYGDFAVTTVTLDILL